MNVCNYVVWDGESLEEYVEDTQCQDCCAWADFQFTSVQEWRRELLGIDVVPAVWFACKPGQAAMELSINGRCNGVFSRCLMQVMEGTPNVTFRDAVRLVNDAMRGVGVDQQSEIVCRADVLDIPIWGPKPQSNERFALMSFDMCRPRP